MNRYLFDGKEKRLLLAEQIRLHKPDIIFCPYPVDAHPDHVAASKITEGARFYAKYTNLTIKGGPHYPFYLFYYFCFHLRMVPEMSFLVNISRQFQEKIKAVKCYKSQFIDNPENVSEYNPPHVPSKTWRECIKKIREVDALLCPHCKGPQILKHLGLWQQKPSRSPPSPTKAVELVEPCYDDWPIYEEPYISVN